MPFQDLREIADAKVNNVRFRPPLCSAHAFHRGGRRPRASRAPPIFLSARLAAFTADFLARNLTPHVPRRPPQSLSLSTLSNRSKSIERAPRREAIQYLSRRAKSLTHIETMPSTALNCFTLPLPLLGGGFSLIVSAAAAVTLADMHTFGTADAYGGGLRKNSRAGTTAAKVANPGGAAGVRPAQIGALTTRAAGTTAPSMMIGSQFAADKTMPSGVRSDGAIGNTTIFLCLLYTSPSPRD